MDFFKRILGGDDDNAAAGRSEINIQVAACALFIEMASIDDEFSDEERENVIAILCKEFNLSREEAQALKAEAAAELAGSIDLWRFTNAINVNYSTQEKIRVVEMLWRVVYTDGHVDAHEDYLMHKLGKLLRLQHKELIAAKLRVTSSDDERN